MDEDTLTQAEVRATTPEALKLLGNASSQISHLRRKKVLKSVNADMQDLADEEYLFKGAMKKTSSRELVLTCLVPASRPK
jgi:hypothetical protein